MKKLLLVGGDQREFMRINKAYGLKITHASQKMKGMPSTMKLGAFHDAVLIWTKHCSHSLSVTAIKYARRYKIPFFTATSMPGALKWLKEHGASRRGEEKKAAKVEEAPANVMVHDAAEEEARGAEETVPKEEKMTKVGQHYDNSYGEVYAAVELAVDTQPMIIETTNTAQMTALALPIVRRLGLKTDNKKLTAALGNYFRGRPDKMSAKRCEHNMARNRMEIGRLLDDNEKLFAKIASNGSVPAISPAELKKKDGEIAVKDGQIATLKTRLKKLTEAMIDV